MMWEERQVNQMQKPQRSWSVIAKDPEEISWGAHGGYDDQVEEYYTYDSNVGNSRNMQPGDLVFVRGKEFVIGFARIDSIESRQGVKELRRCPKCGGNPEPRKYFLPKWRCMKCKFQFDDDELRIDTVEVVKFTASYGNSWVDANLPMVRQELFGYQANKDTQSAIRLLDHSRVNHLISRLIGAAYSNRDQTNFPQANDLIVGGTVIQLSKRRRGQQEFRLSLISRHGERCFISGSQPACVLEAAHLRQFSIHESHQKGEGILLRRDLHALFDRHLIRINPSNLTVQTAPVLKNYKTYHDFEGVEIVPSQIQFVDTKLIAEHFEKATPNFLK